MPKPTDEEVVKAAREIKHMILIWSATKLVEAGIDALAKSNGKLKPGEDGGVDCAEKFLAKQFQEATE